MDDRLAEITPALLNVKGWLVDMDYDDTSGRLTRKVTITDVSQAHTRGSRVII